ncbi:MAG: sterol desaturase family protein [Bacteroidetes bacterium]|nr:sterol desaturase family protein [Bacteroidota bacterium]
MSQLYQNILLLLSIPIYAVLIPAEILLSHFYGWRFYSWKETLTNLYLNLVNAGIDILLRGVALAVLLFFYQFHPNLSWHPVIYWLMLFIGEDFLFWAEHYIDHHVRLFWAVHVTHHSSEEYNLTTGFRSSVLMPFYRYLYFIPLALLGFAPIDIFFMYALTQTYGILVHTQRIQNLPRWIEFLFVTPSHHRVHHASNIPYLDKNMGMVLIIWDRIFGTFSPELPQEKPHYGLTKQVSKPHHPIYIIFHEWSAIFRDFQKSVSFRDKIRYLFYPPGWSHDGSTKTSKQLQDEWKKS